MKKNHKAPGSRESVFPVLTESELMSFLTLNLPGKNRDNIKSLLRNKLVLVNGKTQTHVKFPLKAGDKVFVGRKEIKREVMPGLQILFEDKYLLVVNKPAGLLTISTEKEKKKTVYHALSSHVKNEDPDSKVFIVHRLDRETSGLLVFAKSEEIKYKLQKNWNENILERTYMALVEGLVREDKKTIVSYLKESKAMIVHSSQNESYGQKAITHYELVSRNKNSSLLKVNLETGRKNQIRVHMQEIGHPVVGDKKYGAKTVLPGRIALHASTLSFVHPMSKKPLKFESKTPFK